MDWTSRHEADSRRASWAFAAVAAAIAGAWAIVAWPFAIDDAWIPVRYARHLAVGAGYVWNVGGPATDGVTPLPWAFLLAPLAKGSAAGTLVRAKLLGAGVWIATAGAWGRAVGRADAPLVAKVLALVLLAADLPVGAHSVSGLETPIATALATLAVLSWERPTVAAVFAGWAAALRPEMAPWAIAIAVGFGTVLIRSLSAFPPSRPPPDSGGRRPRSELLPPESGGGWEGGTAVEASRKPGQYPGFSRGRRIAPNVALALAPFLACAVIRTFWFGRPAPLSVYAKPSDLAHGVAYAAAAALVSLGPIALFAPWALARERGRALAVAAAGGVHLVAIAVAGGDWMPYARLAAPIAPGLLLAFVWVSPELARGSLWLRTGVALGIAAWIVPKSVVALRSAGHDRALLAVTGGAAMRGARTIAAVDVGWVSASFEGDIVDLAGVTDPEIAMLPGGHTSKRIDTSMLLARGVDLVLLYSDVADEYLAHPSADAFPRVVEARLWSDPVFRGQFSIVQLLPLGSHATYVARRRGVR